MNSNQKILAFDTATEYLSVALYFDSKVQSELTAFVPRRHSELLPEFVETVLKYSATDLSEITTFAISIGPGSYTGLRVGVSFVQGLVASIGARVIAVDTLEAISLASSPCEEPVAVVFDARAEAFYAGLFDVHGLPAPIFKSGIFSIEELAKKLSSRQKVRIFCDENVAHKLLPLITYTELINTGTPKPSASAIARIAEAKINSGRFTSAEKLEPKYLRDFVPGKRKRKTIL